MFGETNLFLKQSLSWRMFFIGTTGILAIFIFSNVAEILELRASRGNDENIYIYIDQF